MEGALPVPDLNQIVRPSSQKSQKVTQKGDFGVHIGWLATIYGLYHLSAGEETAYSQQE